MENNIRIYNNVKELANDIVTNATKLDAFVPEPIGNRFFY